MVITVTINSRKSIIKYIFTGLNDEKVQITEMVPSLNLYELIFPHLAPSYYDVIATFSDQLKLSIYVVINKKLEHVNMET